MQAPDSPSPSPHVSDEAASDFVVLGKIIGFFGVKGWVKVHSHTEPRENIVSYKQWWLGKGENKQVINVLNGKRTGKNVVAELEGIGSREQAEGLMGKSISIPRNAMPALSNGEIYWTDLVGCDVEDTNGNRLGPVERLFETGANEVLVVIDERLEVQQAAKSGIGKDKTGKSRADGELLIPWIRPDVVKAVDVAARKIVVDWDPDF